MSRNISVLVYVITLENKKSGTTIQRLYLGLNVNVTYVTAGSRSGLIPRYVIPSKAYYTVVLTFRTRHMKYSREQRSRTWTGIQRRMEDLLLKVSFSSSARL
jgi:hypothetical protein